MPRTKQMSVEHIEELHKWLRSKGKTHSARLPQVYSDATEMASLLKKLYPRMVDMHNYTKRFNTQLKLDNWNTLNAKVLTKLGLPQTSKALENLSKGIPGAIESLLNDLMLQDKTNANLAEQENESEWRGQDDCVVVTVNRTMRENNQITQTPQKMILYSVYESLLKDTDQKKEMLNSANEKIDQLEGVIKTKAQRVEALLTQLSKYRDYQTQLLSRSGKHF